MASRWCFRAAPFFGEDIQTLGRHGCRRGIGWKPVVAMNAREILVEYVDRLVKGLAGLDMGKLGALRIGWDAGNGAAGPCA